MSLTETSQIRSVAISKSGTAVISAVAAVVARSKSDPRQTAAPIPRPGPSTAIQINASPTSCAVTGPCSLRIPLTERPGKDVVGPKSRRASRLT